MLVLSRNNRQKIVFPTLGISVEILHITGNKVRLGIEAPLMFRFTAAKSPIVYIREEPSP